MTSVLFVCLGNICRSPLCEGIFRSLVSEAGLEARFSSDSAGTGAWHAGNAPDPRSVAIARQKGIDITDLRARQVTVADFTRYDLVLAMDRNNLRDLRRLAPASAGARVHLFSDFATGRTVDVPHPYYGGPNGFEEVYSMLLSGCVSLLGKLRTELAS